MRRLAVDISRKSNSGDATYAITFESLSVGDEIFTVLFVLFSTIRWYANVAELLFIFALIDKTMLRYKNAKLHMCRKRGKEAERI